MHQDGAPVARASVVCGARSFSTRASHRTGLQSFCPLLVICVLSFAFFVCRVLFEEPVLLVQTMAEQPKHGTLRSVQVLH